MILLLLSIFLLLLHIFYINVKNNFKIKEIYWIIACFSIWFITGFRSFYTGSDTVGYIQSFINISHFSWRDTISNNYRDPFFIIFVKLCSIIFVTERLFLAFTAFLSYIGVFIIIKKKAKMPILALFFYVTLSNFLFNLSGIRQAIAMSMCLIAILYILNRNLYLFCIFVLLGMIFHHSAAIFFPCYFLCKQNINSRILFVYIMITSICIIYFQKLLDLANVILDYNYNIEYIDNGKPFFVILTLILVISYSNKSKWYYTDNNKELFILLLICESIWTFRLIGRVAERPSLYFLGIVPIVLVNSISLEETKKKMNLYLFISIIISLIFFGKRVYFYPYELF